VTYHDYLLSEITAFKLQGGDPLRIDLSKSIALKSSLHLLPHWERLFIHKDVAPYLRNFHGIPLYITPNRRDCDFLVVTREESGVDHYHYLNFPEECHR
jgi:hypothetical protein